MSWWWLVFMTVSCGTATVSRRHTPLELLRQQILQLQGTIGQINSFIAGDFTDCVLTLPAFERKVCEIAQTATAEQQVEFFGQLQVVVKTFQDELYGVDCLDSVAVGCPVAGSILARADDLETDITSLLADVATLQATTSTLASRLDNFNGSGDSIETVLADLEAELDTLTSTVTQGDIYQTHFVCHDNANVGPIFEPVLFTGDQQKLFAYINTTTKNGMGVVAEAGVSGDQVVTTEAATRDCTFKIYDLTTSLKLCWKNDDRSATGGDIDTACDSSNSFASPFSTCTCEG